MNDDSNHARSETTQLRAFYSGHSLSDGVPEAVAKLAEARGARLEFDVQSAGYSLLQDRMPARLAAGARYDALVVTERHDLVEVAVTARTAEHLADIAAQVARTNPDARVYFYHTWLALDAGAPAPWITYERRAEPLWECIASRANRTLTARGETPRIRLLPGATALVAAVEALWRGNVPGLPTQAPRERVRLLFRDEVHLSPLGTRYLGLVHYATLFGRAADAASDLPALPPEAAKHLVDIAARHVRAYAARADRGALREMEACRKLAREVCAECHALRASAGPIGQLKRAIKAARCALRYAWTDDASNPFAR